MGPHKDGRPDPWGGYPETHGPTRRVGLQPTNNQGTFYHGIFVCEAKDQGIQGPEYIFTASSQSKGNLGDIHKHVSLEVELLNPNSDGHQS